MDTRLHNLYGQHGPRCRPCSGLGFVLALSSGGGVTRYASQCRCEGTGIDKDLVIEATMSAIQRQLEQLNALSLAQAKRVIALERQLKRPPSIKNSRQFWMECIAWATADGTAIASSTTETILFPNVTIPANYMSDGREVRLRLEGKYSTLGSGTVSHVYSIRWGGVAGTLLTKTGTVTLLISMTNALFEIEAKLQTRSNGSSGSIMANGVARAFGGTAPTIGSATGAPAIAPLTNGGQTVPAAVTVDLTADTALSVTLTHGANSASNTATGLQYTLDSSN